MNMPANQLDNGKYPGRFGLFLAAASSALLAISAQWPGLVNPLVVNDDVRQQLFWMRRWIVPQLYPPDILGDYSRCYVPWGVQAVYRLGALVLDPLYFSKFVAVALLTALGGLVFLIACRLKGRTFAWMVLAGFWLMPAFIENISGGLARAFAAPLLALFLYAQMSRSRLLALFALCAQALFIPYILPICLGAAALHYSAWKLGLVQSPPLLHSIWDVLAALGTISLVLLWQAGMTKADFGPLPWASEISGRPEFGDMGRFAILPVPSALWEIFGRPWSVLAPFRDGGTTAGILCSVLLFPLMALGARRIDWRTEGPHLLAAGFLFAASLLLYFTAKLLLLKLFIPSRYIEYTTSIIYCVGVPFLLSPLLLPVLKKCSQRIAVALLASVFIVGAVRLHGRELYDYSKGKALYETVRQTPYNALFAGYPELMDNVLTFGQRNVYASFELAHPWSTGYWKVMGPRLEKMLRAYYASTPEEIRRFCIEEGVDYLVVDRRHFVPDYMRGRALFEPYGSLIRQMLDGPGHFALISGAFPGMEINADISILDMRTCQSAKTPSAQ